MRFTLDKLTPQSRCVSCVMTNGLQKKFYQYQAMALQSMYPPKNFWTKKLPSVKEAVLRHNARPAEAQLCSHDLCSLIASLADARPYPTALQV